MANQARTALLSAANREVQVADHMLNDLYPLAHDPKVLIGALEHELRALDQASLALHAAGDTLAADDNTARTRERIAALLDSHAKAPTVFTRGATRIIAQHDFAQLTAIDESAVARDLDTVKRFVHAANTRILLER